MQPDTGDSAVSADDSSLEDSSGDLGDSVEAVGGRSTCSEEEDTMPELAKLVLFTEHSKRCHS